MDRTIVENHQDDFQDSWRTSKMIPLSFKACISTWGIRWSVVTERLYKCTSILSCISGFAVTKESLDS